MQLCQGGGLAGLRPLWHAPRGGLAATYGSRETRSSFREVSPPTVLFVAVGAHSTSEAMLL